MNNRYDFLFLFDITDGNPNGDPDAGNMPRTDPETNQGLVTDVCIKRKIRNFVQLSCNGVAGNEIYVAEKAVLNTQHQRAYTATNQDPTAKKGVDINKVRAWMCENFYDIRTFGAVMSTGVNCGQVRGPVQLTFSRSVSPITPTEHSLTRCAVTTEKEADKQNGGNRTIGKKYTIPYGLYVGRGFINVALAKQTGWTDKDLELFKQALNQMFEIDRAAARGTMGMRRVIAFKHDSELGCAPAHKLFDLVSVTQKPDVTVARKFEDYTVSVGAPPKGVVLEEWV
jgi:CRISPR-associated protein Csd2